MSILQVFISIDCTKGTSKIETLSEECPTSIKFVSKGILNEKCGHIYFEHTEPILSTQHNRDYNMILNFIHEADLLFCEHTLPLSKEDIVST